MEEIFQLEKEEFQPHIVAIDANLAKQSDLFDELTTTNMEFVQSKQNDPARDSRQRYLQRLNEACAKFTKLITNLREGRTFYKDLTRDFLNPLKDVRV